MTLTEARERTTTSLAAAFASRRPKVYVDTHPGTIDEEEIRRRFSTLPAVLAGVLGRVDDGIRVVVYVLSRPNGPDLLPILDIVEETVRALPGGAWAPLDVQTQNLYDAKVGKIGATLWAVTTVWPPLAWGDPPPIDSGLIAAANAFFAAVIPDAVPGGATSWLFGYTEHERRRLLQRGPLPFVLVSHGVGTIEHAGTSTYKYRDASDVMWQRESRGVRTWPVMVDFWARGETEADEASLSFVEALPREWEYLNYARPVRIAKVGAEYKDTHGAYVATVEVEMHGVLAGEATQVPVIRSVTTGVDEGGA